MASARGRERADATKSNAVREPVRQRTSGNGGGGQLDPQWMLAAPNPSSMLALQRSVGNATVAVMIGEHQAEPSPVVRMQRATRLYAGNLSFRTSRESLESVFAEVGEVREVAMPTDRETGQPRGFAFVTMGTAQAASDAVSRLDGTMLDGRPLRVNEAQERSPGGGGGGGFGGGGGRGGGGGGGRGGRGGGGRDRY